MNSTKLAAGLTATLAITAALSVAPASGQDYSREPTYGAGRVAAGQVERVIRIQAGGSSPIDTFTGPPCRGYIAQAPDYRFEYAGGPGPLTIAVTSDTPTTLLVNGPGGGWTCIDGDVAPGGGPVFSDAEADAGQYDVWVGTLAPVSPNPPAMIRIVPSVTPQIAAGAASVVRAKRDGAEVLRTVTFSPADDDLGANQQAVVQAVGRGLTSTGRAGCDGPCPTLAPGLRITVIGHALIPGDIDDLMMLSQIRAMRVRDELIASGVPGDRIWTAACGDAAPLLRSNSDRVEILIGPEDKDPPCQ